MDVFTGSKDNQPLTITDKDGKERRIVMRQGNEHGAGTKHSIFGHYGTSSNQYKAEEILFIPDIIKNGERKQKGGKVAYEIVRDGVTYTVTTEQSKSGLERFTNFYTNRKPTTVLNDTSNTDEQHASQQSVSSAKLQKVPEKDAAETEKIFNAAKKRFGTTQDLREAGYILPDGTMLDFSGRHQMDEGADTSGLRGQRAVDHRDVKQLNYEADGNTPSGIDTSMPDFIERGAIRIDVNAGTINLAVAPTAAQQAVLRRLVARNDGAVSVDFGNGWDSEHYAEYDEASPRRVLSDIDRYFVEGIKPQGDIQFFRTADGEAYGFTLGGKIYLDPRIATSETPVHEYVHLWSEALEKANPEAWGHLKEQLLGKEDVLAYVKRRYPELTDENDLMHEVFSHYAGKRGAERLRREAKEEMAKAQGVFSKARVMNIFNTIRKALNRYWTMARNLFAGYNDKLKDMSAEDFADMAMADMLGGFDPRTEIRKREANPHKDAQLRLVVGRNAMEDDYHVGIRSIDDIKTYEEAVREGEGLDSYPDFTREDAERALQEGEITVYSSKPIEQGGFVSTSRMEAKEYAGGGRVYEKRVSLDDVAWIYAGEGQYAKVDEAYSEEKIREIVGDKVTDKNVSRVRGIIPLYNFLGNPKNHEVYAPYRSVHRTPTLNDYYIHTDAKFKAVPTGDRGVADAWQGMKASGKYEHHKSPLSDSEYLIDRESGDIYRMSDHWGRVASCQWDIDNPAEGMQIGKANIKDFKGNRRGGGYEVEVSNFRTSYFNALDKTVKNLETLLGGGIEIDDAVRGRLERALDFYRTAKENHTVLDSDRLFYSLAPGETIQGYGVDAREIALDDRVAQRDYLLSDNYVSSLTGDEFAKSDKPLTERVAEYYTEKYDGKVEREGLGTVILDKRGVKDSLSHGIGRNKAAAFAAVPDIICNGVLIDQKENWKNRKYDSYTIAAPIEIAGEGFVGVAIVTRGHGTNANRFYLHEVVLQKNLLDESIKTDTEADSHRGDVAKVLKEIVSAKENGENVTEDTAKYRIREDEAPTKTGIGYKVFVLKDGKLYPPMVANPNGEATPVGVWLDADAAPVAGVTKTGRQQVKAGGKGTQGGSGKLAYRPGWHLGEIPYALQFNRMNPETGQRELFPANFVWAEVEYANDVDYQEEAMSYGMNASGKFQHSLAGLPRLPENGSYRYRTNPDPNTDPWVITGAMKVNRILKPSEVDAMVEAAGREPQQRQAGAITDEQVEALNAKVKRTMQEDRDMMRSAVQQMGEKLHTSINIIEDVNEITHPNAAVQERRRNSKGWYDTATGQVNIVLDNNKDIDDVKASVGHEIIAHKGLRELVGEENYDEFLDETYQHLRDDLKKGVDDAAGRAFVDDTTKNGKRAKSYEQHRRNAVDELFGRMAEKPFEEFSEGERTLWQKIKATVRRLLDKFLGSLKLPKWFELGDNELRYILWRSKERLERGKERPIDLARDIVKREELGLGEDNTLYSETKKDAHPTRLQTSDDAQAVQRDAHLSGTKVEINSENREEIDKNLSSLAEHIDEVIGNSIEVEEHPDYQKNESGERDTQKVNGGALMHRFYGVANIDGADYRVMTLMKEENKAKRGNGIHSYEVQKIEVLDEETPNTPNGSKRANGYVHVAKLLQNVEKAHDLGKTLLEQSKLADESTDLYRDPGEAEGLRPEDDVESFPELAIVDADIPEPTETEKAAIAEDIDKPVGVMASMREYVFKAAKSSEQMREAVNGLAKDLRGIRKAMSMQKDYDRKTAKSVVDMVKVQGVFSKASGAESGWNLHRLKMVFRIVCASLLGFGSRRFFCRLFGGNFLCNGCLLCGYFGSRCFSSSLARTTRATRLLFCRLGHVLIVVNEFDKGHVGTITLTEAEFDDSSVSTRTVGHFLGDVLEQFCYGIFVAQITEHNTTRVGGIVLRLGDEGLDVFLQSLCLGESRSDSFVHDQGHGHVGKHGGSVGCSATQMVEFLIVSHCCFERFGNFSRLLFVA